MLRFSVSACAALIALHSSTAWSEDSCDSVFTENIRNLRFEETSIAELNTIYDNYCSASGETNSKYLNTDLEAVVKKIPVKFSLNKGSASERMESFCKLYNEVRYKDEYRTVSTSEVLISALQQYNVCRKIAKESGVRVTRSSGTTAFTIFFEFLEQNRVLKLEHVATSPNLKCSTTSIDGKKQMLDSSTAHEFRSNFEILCQRDQMILSDGTTEYQAGSVEIGTTFGPYSIPIFADALYNNQLASEATKTIADLTAQTQSDAATLAKLQTENEQLKKSLADLTPSSAAWETFFVSSRANSKYKDAITEFLNKAGPRPDGIEATVATQPGNVNFFIWARKDQAGSKFKVYDIPFSGSWQTDLAAPIRKKKLYVLGWNNSDNNALFVAERED